MNARPMTAPPMAPEKVQMGAEKVQMGIEKVR
jgi:hypothetical protein